MQNLLDFLARHFHWLVFLLLETVSGILLFSYNSYQGSTWISTANAITGKTLELQADVEQFFSLKRLNEELSQRNIVLEQKVQMLMEKQVQATQAPTSLPPTEKAPTNLPLEGEAFEAEKSALEASPFGGRLVGAAWWGPSLFSILR